MTVGVLLHVDDPSFVDVADIAREAERAGADWLGVADAFWWHDGWLQLAGAAAVTERIELGLAVTNPYLRHPFHTVAALASLQALAGERVFLGLAAGGTEISATAGVDRRDAAERIVALAQLTRRVAAGEPLDPGTGRRLGPRLVAPPILVAGRGARVLRAAGAVADRALLWAVPISELERSAQLIRAGAVDRDDGPPTIVWSPIVDHDGSARRSLAYAVLNSRRSARQRWGVDEALAATIAEVAVRDGNAAASELVPAAAADDFVLVPGDIAGAADTARRLGVRALAVRASSPDGVAAAVAWADAVLAAIDTDTATAEQATSTITSTTQGAS